MLDRIYIIGEPILRKKLKAVKDVSSQEKELFDEMINIMHQRNGIGLAANQVGIDKQMCVVDVGGKIFKLANPKILKRKGKDTLEEGCLSLPDVTVRVKRARTILCRALNEKNEVIKFEASGITARAIQHELDHLLGKMIIDYAPLWKRIAFHHKLLKAIKKNK